MRGILGGRAIRTGARAGGAPSGSTRATQSMLTFDAQGKPRTLSLTGAPALLWEAGAPPDRAADRASSSRTAAPRPPRATGGVRIEGEDGHAEARHGHPRLLEGRRGPERRARRRGQGAVRRPHGRRGPRGRARRARPLAADGRRRARGAGRRAAARSSRPIGSSSTSRASRSAAKGARAPCSAPTRRKDRAPRPSSGDPKQAELRQGRPHRRSTTRRTSRRSRARPRSGRTTRRSSPTTSRCPTPRRRSPPCRTSAPCSRPTGAGPPKARRADAGLDRRSRAERLLYRDTDRSGAVRGRRDRDPRRRLARRPAANRRRWLGKDRRGVDCMEISGRRRPGGPRARAARRRPRRPSTTRKQGKTVLWGSPARVDGRRGQPGRRRHLDDHRAGA